MNKLIFLLLFPILVYSSDNETQGIPKIVGEWKVGKTLSVDVSKITDEDGIGSVEYQWLRDGREIDGESSSSYYLLLSDLKKSISVRLKHTDALGNIQTITSKEYGEWGYYQYLKDEIQNAQAAVVRITASTAVMIAPNYAITAAHSPLDENNEITPDLTVQNIYGEVRDIIDVKYDVDADFAIVELESPFENSYAVELATINPTEGDPAFAIGNPKDVAWGGVGWAVSFGFARDPNLNNDDHIGMFDIQIMGGYSGGGIFNESGQLQGIISYSTSAYSDGSFRENTEINTGGYFRENFEIIDGPIKELNNHQVGAVNLNYIKKFMSDHDVENIKNLDNIILPQNDKDTYFNTLSDEQENQFKTLASPLRKSVVSISLNTLSDSNYPNGTGFFISDRIIATNSHVVEGKENPIITTYDLKEHFGTVLDHHPEGDVSLILLDNPVSGINPINLAESRPVFGNKGIVIGHPQILWSQAGAWQVLGSSSGYLGDQLDDRGDILFEGGGGSGMSGGPMLNSDGKLVGVVWAHGNRLYTQLDDYQDPHTTYYNPVVTPGVMHQIGVDLAVVRELIDENSIYLPDHASQNSAYEIEYLSSNDNQVFSVEKESNSSLSIKKVDNYEFKDHKTLNLSISSDAKWSLLDALNYNDNYIILNSYLLNNTIGVNVSSLNKNFDFISDFNSDGQLDYDFNNEFIQKLIKSQVYNDKLYLLAQNAENNQISYSVYTLDLNNPNEFVNLFKNLNPAE